MVPLYKKDAAIHQLSTWVTMAWVSTYARILLSSAQRINQGLRVYQQTQQANQSFSADYYGRVIFSAFFVNRHKASFMLKKNKQKNIHMCEWKPALCVCVSTEAGSPLYPCECAFPYCFVWVWAERRTLLFMWWTRSVTRAWARDVGFKKKKRGGREKSSSSQPPTSLHFTHLPIQQVGLFIATVYSSEYVGFSFIFVSQFCITWKLMYWGFNNWGS